MRPREEFLLYYEINYNIFELHYSLLKEPKLQENRKQIQQNEMQKREQKVKIKESRYIALFVVSGLSKRLTTHRSLLKHLRLSKQVVLL